MTNQSGIKNGLVESNSNAEIKSYVYQPLSYKLSKDQIHSFKVFVEDANKVALLDENKKWHYLGDREEDSVWTLSVSFDCLGKVSLYAKNDPNSNTFKSLCTYCVV